MFHGLGGMPQSGHGQENMCCTSLAPEGNFISRMEISSFFTFFLFSFFDILLMVVANNSIINYMLNKQSNI